MLDVGARSPMSCAEPLICREILGRRSFNRVGEAGDSGPVVELVEVALRLGLLARDVDPRLVAGAAVRREHEGAVDGECAREDSNLRPAD